MTDTAPNTGSNRRFMVCGGVAASVMLAGALGLYAAQSYWKLVLNKPPAPLSKPLPELSNTLGRFFRKTMNEDLTPAHDGTLTESVVEGLGTKDYLLRTYIDSDPRPDGGKPWQVSLNLNYYAKGDATPHVPDRCWVANGRQPPEPQMVPIKGVVRKDGSVVDIEMRMLSFYPSREELGDGPSASLTGTATPIVKTDLRKNVGYIFHVNGQYVSNPLAVASLFWNAKNKYAYHAKIEVTVDQLCTPDEAKVVLSNFMRDSIAGIEECLPDPKILTDEPSTATRPATATNEARN